MSSFYTVRVNETIRDAVINGSGSIINWDTIAKANGFTDWTPALVAGQLVFIPDSIIVDANTLQDKNSYPANNGTVPGFLQILQTIWDLINDNWILKNGFWDDNGIWIDSDNWKDS